MQSIVIMDSDSEEDVELVPRGQKRKISTDQPMGFTSAKLRNSSKSGTPSTCPAHQSSCSSCESDSDDDGIQEIKYDPFSKMCCVTKYLANQTNTLICTRTYADEFMYIKFPEKYWSCNHKKTDKNAQKLGQGSFGTVVKHSAYHVAKKFLDTTDMFHEVIGTEMVKLGVAMKGKFNLPILLSSEVCIPCKTIFYPLKKSSLLAYHEWDDDSTEQLVDAFKGLSEAVDFLHETCNIFHSDIDPANILVEKIRGAESGIARLILTDFGVCSLHDLNKYTHIRLHDKNDKTAYSMIYQRMPDEMCKQFFKPFFVLSYLYKRALRVPELNDPYGFGPVPHRIAYKVDTVALGMSLLWAIIKMTDITNKTRVFGSYDHMVPRRSAYLIQLLAPKVVLLEILSDLWGLDLNLGLTSDGTSKGVILTTEDVQELRKCTAITKKNFADSLFFTHKYRLQNSELRNLVRDFMKHDYFVPDGR